MPEIENRVAGLPFWSGPVRLEPLVGGLSNVSFLATDRSGRYVVRLARDFPFHHVDRARELIAARAAGDARLAPEIVHAEPGLTICRYIDGHTLGAADIRADIGRVVDLVGRLHRELAPRLSGAPFIFWVFHVIRDYARQLRRRGHDAATLDRWLALSAELEAAQVPLPIVAGHHDLLPSNLIDDGRRLWLIDYEYAGFGTAMFDLANLSSNSAFPPDLSRDLLSRYFGAPPLPELLRSHAAMECASLLREALWARVSEHHLDAPGADYAAYAEENFTRFETALARYRERFAGAR